MNRLIPLLSPLVALATGCYREMYEDLDSDWDGTNVGWDCEPSNPEVQSWTWFLDRDGDGHGDPLSSEEGCQAPDDGRLWVAEGDDCDDRDAAAWLEVEAYEDLDGDGDGAEGSLSWRCVGEAGWAAEGQDCDDTDPDRHEGAEPVCGNGLDDNCDLESDCEALDEDRSASAAGGTWTGESGARLGAAVAAVGDVNGDGRPDALLGAPGKEGASYVLFGPLGGADSAEARADLRYATEDPAELGAAGAAAGDVSGDGYDDLILGAPGAAGGGSAWLIHGPLAASDEVLDPDRVEGIRFHADDADEGASLGAAVLGVGELFGHAGFSDVAIGAPGANDGAGAVYLVGGPVLQDPHLDDVDEAHVLEGPAGAALGTALARLDDLDGDGLPEVAVSAPGYDPDALRSGPLSARAVGGVFVLFDGLSDGLLEDVASFRLTGATAGTRLGAALASVSDDSGDGYADLLVGAPSFDGDAGGAWLISGEHLSRARGELVVEQNLASVAGGGVDELGAALTNAGDLDGDGFDELWIGAPGYDLDGRSWGAAGLWRGPLEGALEMEHADALIVGVSQVGRFGSAVAATAAGEVLLGAPKEGARSGDEDWRGTVYVFFLGL